ncbi:MAG: ABC transporter permease, partial [Bacteroidetes bacterium]|nr:ABC transporter permease [Bacteroidota bacterium]
MKTYFLLAWRNLWRNKRRTLIASASIFFAVIFALLMRSMQEGSYDYMVDASVSMYTGYIQVHA